MCLTHLLWFNPANSLPVVNYKLTAHILKDNTFAGSSTILTRSLWKLVANWSHLCTNSKPLLVLLVVGLTQPLQADLYPRN